MAKGMQTRQPSKSGKHIAAKTVRGGEKRITEQAAQPKTAAKKAAKPGSKSVPKKAATRPSGYDPIAPQRVQEILSRLDAAYPGAKCALNHSNAWELTVATILSAQCTDARVNMVTPELFHKYPTPQALAKLEPEQLEPEIKSTGFFRNKAKSIVGAARKLVAEFGGEVPNDMDKLLTLPGVARKTANVVLGSWFGIADGVVVDTHVHRISRRLELTQEDEPQKIEQDLMRVIPRDKWIDFAHRVIHHGRALCVARQPKCAECPLENICHAADKTWSTVEIHATAEP